MVASSILVFMNNTALNILYMSFGLISVGSIPRSTIAWIWMYMCSALVDTAKQFPKVSVKIYFLEDSEKLPRTSYYQHYFRISL